MDRIKIPGIFAARLAGQGLAPEHVLRQAHLPQTLLAQDKILLSTAQFFALWQAVEQLSDDPAVGLKIGSDPHIERYDPVTLSALSARSFRDALTQLARYKELVCAEEVLLGEEGETIIVKFVWPLAAVSTPTLLLDAAFASVAALGQRGTGRALFPNDAHCFQIGCSSHARQVIAVSTKRILAARFSLMRRVMRWSTALRR